MKGVPHLFFFLLLQWVINVYIWNCPVHYLVSFVVHQYKNAKYILYLSHQVPLSLNLTSLKLTPPPSTISEEIQKKKKLESLKNTVLWIIQQFFERRWARARTEYSLFLVPKIIWEKFSYNSWQTRARIISTIKFYFFPFLNFALVKKFFALAFFSFVWL